MQVFPASQLLAAWRETPPCPAPRKRQLVVSAAAPLPCGEPATVLTAVPMRNNKTGELGTVPQKLCLDHSIEAASWKLIYAILQHDRKNPRRVIAA